MDIIFLESNTFILEDIKEKLELTIKNNKPLIFFNQLGFYAEKGIQENQKKILSKIIKKNKVSLIYIRQFSNSDTNTFDNFFQDKMVKLGLKRLLIIEVSQFLDDDYIVNAICRIFKFEK